jgi:hypothetical protein
VIYLVIGLAGLALAYGVSLAVFPWRPCRHCNGRGRLTDPVFSYAHRDCPQCNGRGRLPRLGRRVFYRGRKP